MANNKSAGLVVVVVETPGLIPTQFRPHRTLVLFQIDANMGQLGLGEDSVHSSTPRLLSYSQLTEVTRIQAGDSYSAAVTAGGELFLWGQIPCVSRVSEHPGLKRLWTPQPVPLASGKVRDVACGTWHIMALSTRSRECAHPETEAPFSDHVSNPLPTERENTVQDFVRVQHKLLQGPGRPESPEEHGKDDKSESAVEEERPNKDEGDGALPDSAPAVARLEGESSSSSTLPRLLTGQQAHSRVSAVARKERSIHLTELVQKSRSNNSSPILRPKPTPPGRCAIPEAQRVASCHRLRTGLHTGPKSLIYSSSPCLSPGQQVQMSPPSFYLGPQVRTSLSPTPSSSDPFRYCPTHRGPVFPFGTSPKNQ
ncbi:hypothetical protein D9C73_012290 [Collichthys lucidus]|uniref:Uncharacterized protein n=1 Tax=Collichthys lucidus TaxID=240159 RepID=A0A4U5UUP3_COLLU|nr:hypothetical protein D9C73_012290 [Collichthys lucidus]